MNRVIQYFITAILFKIIQPILCTVHWTRMFIYIRYWTLNLYIILLPIYVNSFTWFSVVSFTLISSSMVVIEFGWNIISVFFMLILRPKFDDALANASTILWISSAEWAISALSSQKAVLSQVYVWFCIPSDVCNCKEVCILAWLDADSVPRVP